MEAIAKRAGVSKETLYRWWHSKTEVVLDALAERGQQTISLPDTGTLRGDLRAFLRATVDSGDPATVRLLHTIAAAAASDESVADQVRDRFLVTRRQDLGQILHRAVSRGEITSQYAALAIDLIYGSLWYRLIFRVGPLDYQWADAVAEAIASRRPDCGLWCQWPRPGGKRDPMTTVEDQEKFSFQAEVVQILDLMINSLYSNKEIFLRELISNASDAIDRLRIELLSRSEDPAAEGALQIRVSHDSGARTITIADNGIGMSRTEVIEHIGTIAKSGTREFLQALTGDQRKDATLIGQFGVGFYSAFIVADRVTLTTRRAGMEADQGVRWTSDGRGEYTLETVELPARGTTVVLHLRDGEDDLLSGYRLRSIIRKYSDHISLPILMPAEKSGELEGSEETVNQGSALWARPKSEISDQDYIEFYRHISSDYSDPLGWVHSKIEGTYEYTLLLFIPSHAPFDLWLPDSSRGIRLHVRRIFILEDSGQLLPRYLRFLRGVIDSADLPLNVSRELLQGSRVVDRIRSSAVKRVLQFLKDMAEKEPEKYGTFWKEFGAVLKEGVVEDFGNRDDIAHLLRFTSTSSGEADVTLSDYVARMKEGQEKIYYLVAPTLAAASSSPHLEAFRAKGVEVLLLADPVDNWLVTSLPEFEGKRLQSVAEGAADLGALQDEAEKAASEQASTEFADLVGKLKEILDGRAWDVRVTSRLTTSPACIVANAPELDINLARRLAGSGLPSQPVLEINPRHQLIERLNRRQDDPLLADWAHVLFSQAVLTFGARIDDPAAYVTRLNDLLTSLVGDD